MTGKLGRAAVAALMIAMASGQASAATSNCWAAQTVSAAKVRDLQTMLMVAGLRCRGTASDVLAGYNRFVATNRTAIVAFNDQLKGHFRAIHGAAEGQRRYDRFTTALANAYGAGGEGTANCADMARLADDAAAARSASALIALAEERSVSPDLPGETCSIRIAAK
jgi:predicted RNase H-like nuclease